METTKVEKEYREERFEFALYVNNNLICKRNFKINNYIEESMNSMDFKVAVDGIVNMIDDDLKSKSRVYTWYYYNTDKEMYDIPEDFEKPALEPWECTFKFVVTDNKVPVIEKIWDGYGYPKAIRERVDIANKTVKITTYDGRVLTYDKEKYFGENTDRLSTEMYILKAMIMDKQDLLLAITKKICETCSPRENSYQVTSDYTLSETYQDRNFVIEDGKVKLTAKGKPVTVVNKSNNKKYYYSRNMAHKKYVAEWGKAVAEKTKEYLKSLYK